ncbi:MAG: relaxase/mobilization nuclease domain-containing protein, partial [Lachnospiraceae bacterium]|nr:relaxase/mobilization nuclease domain-containing protein [Lachnospiraceae bacterium]
MAIEKDIAITCDDSQYSGARGITQLIMYIKDDHHNGNKVRNVIDYAENPEKTTHDHSEGSSSEYLMNGFANKQVLVSSLSHGEVCRQLDEIDFMEDKEQYEQYKAGDRRGMGRVDKGEAKVRDAYHVIQSFPGKEHGVDLDPRLAHQIGVEYARRAFPGYKVVVATHLNTEHVHNHIAVCAYNEDHRHKLNFDSAFRRNIRRINDELCMAYNLPVLEEERAYRHRQGVLHEEGLIKNRGGISMKDIIRNDIKRALSEAGDTFRWFPDFVRYMEDHMDYKIIQTTKNVTYIKKDLLMKNGKPFRCRDATLGEEYTRRYISEQLHWPILRTVRHIGKLGLEGHEYISEKDSRIRKALANGRNEEGYDKVFGDPQDTNRSWHIHIDRYDENGRRRSDLELIILTAIEFVKRVRTCFVIVMEKLGLSRGRTESMMFGIDPDRDEDRLTKALGKIRRYGKDNEEQLN